MLSTKEEIKKEVVVPAVPSSLSPDATSFEPGAASFNSHCDLWTLASNPQFKGSWWENINEHQDTRVHRSPEPHSET